jgi:hypothetical protein
MVQMVQMVQEVLVQPLEPFESCRNPRARVAPMAAYVYGALSLGWGFNELSAAFVSCSYEAAISNQQSAISDQDPGTRLY